LKAHWSIVASLFAHVLVVSGVGFVAYRSLAEKQAREVERRRAEGPAAVIAIELPGVAEGALLADRDVIPEGTKPEAFGGAKVARLDTGSPGSGGETTGARATNLAAMDDRMKLDTDLLSRLDRDQVQRLKTAPRRTTHEDRRSTTNPMELTFLATGKGEHQERRPNAPNDPSRGSLFIHSAAAVVGGHIGSNSSEDDAPGSSPGAEKAGQLLGVRASACVMGVPGPNIMRALASRMRGRR
jgi:hypothetical protein